MALIIDRQNGQNYAANIINPVLNFISGTWNVISGTGTAQLNSNIVFSGDKSLRLENTFTTTSLIASNTNQDTVIKNDGSYQLSWYAYKNDPLFPINCNVLIYKNGALLDTQFFQLGNEDADLDIDQEWARFQSSQNYNLLANDVITFQFEIIGIGATRPSTVIYIDGMMLNKGNRQNFVVPVYQKPNGDLYNLYTGWADYTDTTYTDASPFTVLQGSKVDLPNNAGAGVTSQTPIDVDTFYDGTVITGRNGDGINITIDFKCRPAGAGANPRLKTSIDIGGAVGEIYLRDFFLNKGSGVIHNYLTSNNAYTLETWEANGGKIKIEATNEDIEIFDIRYIITRTHKAR